MSSTEHAALLALLAQMRDTYDNLLAYDAGISILHLDAAVAALEDRLERSGKPAARSSYADFASSTLLQ